MGKHSKPPVTAEATIRWVDRDTGDVKRISGDLNTSADMVRPYVEENR